MLNRIADTYQRIAGGAIGWDSIILTGGGSALLYKRLLPTLNHENVILADDIENIHLANVRGGEALAIIRGVTSVMSEVISFRLDTENPREARAQKVLTVWQEEGYSIRHTITEALLTLEDPRTDPFAVIDMEELNETLYQVSQMLEQMEDGHLVPAIKNNEDALHSKLTDTFVASIKKAAKHGLKID